VWQAGCLDHHHVSLSHTHVGQVSPSLLPPSLPPSRSLSLSLTHSRGAGLSLPPSLLPSLPPSLPLSLSLSLPLLWHERVWQEVLARTSPCPMITSIYHPISIYKPSLFLSFPLSPFSLSLILSFFLYTSVVATARVAGGLARTSPCPMRTSIHAPSFSTSNGISVIACSLFKFIHPS
jgi:hypothetical protein